MAWVRFVPTTWKLRVWHSTTRPLAPIEAHGCQQLAQRCYPAMRWPGVKPATSRSLSNALPLHYRTTKPRLVETGAENIDRPQSSSAWTEFLRVTSHLHYSMGHNSTAAVSSHPYSADQTTGTRRCDHVTPVLCVVHWLLLRHAARQFQGCHARPSVAVRKSAILRSFADDWCVVTRTHSSFGDRAFAAAGPAYGTVMFVITSHLKDADLSWYMQ